ncbi:ABC transporter permease [Natronorubrum tibetense]|uniref:ABC transporter integral membrane subunit n=1 Tax=Natronorubrum tibetense GA33 TaxID=1114856 RepID=L9VX75_9EURY|nr:ABC transporter permease [Natronorubrum tibetense]ELY41795.1 ABC transporter integral membrane subunit [Natronorubrum tibetense GA33]
MRANEDSDHNQSNRSASEPVVTDGSGAIDGASDPLDVLAATPADDSSPAKRRAAGRHLRTFVLEPWETMRRDWRAVTGLAIVSTYLLVGLVGPLLVEPTSVNDAPHRVAWFQSLEHPLGTDPMGRDLFSEMVHSTRPMLQMMLTGGLFTIVVGTAFGTVAGYKGGTVDTVLSGVTDIFINIPGLPLVIVLAVIFQPSNPFTLGVLLTVAAWAGLARAVRSQVLQLRHESFIEASRTIGIPTGPIVLKDVLPALLPYIAVNFVSAMRNVIFSAAGLYFIGVLPFEDTNWGITLRAAYDGGAMYRVGLLHWILVPTLAIIVLSMGLILLAQSSDRVFNPRVREKHRTERTEGAQNERVNETGTGFN